MKYELIILQGSQPEQEPKQATPLVLPSTPKPSSPCGCGCSEVRAVLSENSTHYASWHCTDCDRFRGWVRKPTRLTAARSEDELIDALLASGRLNDWEIRFCQSIKRLKNRTPGQKEKLREIVENLGLGGHKQVADTSAHLFTEGGER